MTRITTTNQKKNTTIPGIAYPATVLALATDSSYPAPSELSAILYTFTARRRPPGATSHQAGIGGFSRLEDLHVLELAERVRRDGMERGVLRCQLGPCLQYAF